MHHGRKVHSHPDRIVPDAGAGARLAGILYYIILKHSHASVCSAGAQTIVYDRGLLLLAGLI